MNLDWGDAIRTLSRGRGNAEGDAQLGGTDRGPRGAGLTLSHAVEAWAAVLIGSSTHLRALQACTGDLRTEREFEALGDGRQQARPPGRRWSASTPSAEGLRLALWP